MASINLPINIKKLLADQQAVIIANTNEKAVATQAHVTTRADATNVEIANKAVDTQNAIVGDGDITQAKIDALTVVNGDISTDVQAINGHTTDVTSAISTLPQLAPDLNWPSSRGVSIVQYVSINSLDTSAGLTPILSLSGKFLVSLLYISSIAAGNAAVRLTIDGVVIWDDEYENGTSDKLLGSYESMGGQISTDIMCNESLLLEYQSQDTNIQLRYLARPIL